MPIKTGDNGRISTEGSLPGRGSKGAEGALVNGEVTICQGGHQRGKQIYRKSLVVPTLPLL